MSIDHLRGLEPYAASVTEQSGTTYSLVRDPASGQKWLAVQGDANGFEGGQAAGEGATLFPLTPPNAAALRARLPWLNPVPLELRTSAGFGDRLGLATPGHVQAVAGTGIAPIFAQQSVRENARTGRTPQEVIDDAMWGAFQAGWREDWGADADHLKRPEDIAPFVQAGYSFFTVDPSDYVDNAANADPVAVLREKVAALPWAELDTSEADLRARFLVRPFDLGTQSLAFDEETLLRAAAKYGGAVAHVKRMAGHLNAQMGSKPFDFEVSIDETDTPSTIHEHYYIAAEMRRLGIVWVSLAPRFVGRFEKGVDYIGDLAALDANLAGHAAVMHVFGGYKLSLHSGSDKFSVYPLAVRHAHGSVHLKTAGTSYLEALRVWAEIDPAAFREVLDFSRARYETDRATYHVSAQLERVPPTADLSDGALPGLLDQFDARQVLHVTFGSVLDQYGDALRALLRAHEDRYDAVLKRHFDRHLDLFSTSVTAD
ncbi:tagaturonate epimerase family protein [Aggregatilinea lenta]|uniref:tagaturonate epimerase family protein n=1 Tax=Aggregatilinea lenta TaxID=913108 RepID=UPI000E5B675C|nr:tagaturonate epimerase family protein [Aggregatilinea lenta]